MQESTKSITPATITDIYKDLKTPQLEALIAQVLEGVTFRVSGEFDSICERYDVNDKLLALEELMDKAAAQKTEEESLKRKASGESAASPNSKVAKKSKKKSNYKELPENVTPQDVLRYQSYKMRKLEHDRLLSEIQSLEETNARLGEEVEGGKKEIEIAVRGVEEVKGEMERIADVCGGR